MKIAIRDIIRYELIGLNAVIVDSKNSSDIGIKGKIVDETKSTLIIEDRGKRRRVFKNNITLNLNINKKAIRITGRLLFGRPKERIKKI